MGAEEPTVTVRRATTADRQALVGLLVQLVHDESDDYRPNPEAIGRSVDTFLGERRVAERFFLVAELDSGEVVGLLSVQSLYSTWRGHPFFLVEDVSVAPQHRRSGAGTALLKEVERFAREAGACKIDLHVRSINLGAITLVSRAGYRKVGDVHLTRDLHHHD